MAFKFNPFTGNFDDVADVSEKVESSSGSSTDNAIVRWDGTTGTLVQDSSVLIDNSDNITGVASLVSPILQTNSSAGLSLRNTGGTSVLTLGAGNGTGATFAGGVVITGNLQINGTTTTVNSTTLDVADANITINDGGNDASAEGSGLTIERTGTNGSLVYENLLTSKFKIGEAGSEIEIANVSSTQTFSNKTLDNSNAITVQDSNFTVQNNSDNTKQIEFDLSSISTSTTRTFDFPDTSGEILTNNAIQTVFGKTIGNSNGVFVRTDRFQIQDQTDTSKIINFNLSNISTSTTRTLTVPDASDEILLRTAAQTIANKVFGVNNTFNFNDNSTDFRDNGDLSKRMEFQLSNLPTSTTVRISPSVVDGTMLTSNISSNSGTFNASLNTTHIVDTSSSSATITLPAPSENAYVNIKDNGNSEANNITINQNSSETIDGDTSITINSNYESLKLISDGTNWYIL